MEYKAVAQKLRTENNHIYQFLKYLRLGVSGGAYDNLIYRCIFGKPLKELESEYGVKLKETIRDYLTAEQIKEVENTEMLVSGLINCGWGYEQIKDFLEINCAKRLAS